MIYSCPEDFLYFYETVWMYFSACFLKASIQIGLLNLFNFRLNITNVLLYDMGKNFTSFALVLNLCMFTNVCIYTMVICVFYKIK